MNLLKRVNDLLDQGNIPAAKQLARRDINVWLILPQLIEERELGITLRRIMFTPETIQDLEHEHGGKVIRNERLNSQLERVLRAKKARHPNMRIKIMSSPHFPGEEFVPVEIVLDMFGFKSRTGFHVFIKRKKVFVVS